MRKDQTMRAILAAIEAKEAEIERLNIEIGALRAVYNQEAGIAPDRARAKRAPRSNVKTAVLDLLRQVGANGLNAQIAHDLAKENGVDLHIKSVSSLLSRLKSEGTVTYRDSLYRLVEYEPKEPSKPEVPRNYLGRSGLPGLDGVVPLRTSG